MQTVTYGNFWGSLDCLLLVFSYQCIFTSYFDRQIRKNIKILFKINRLSNQFMGEIIIEAEDQPPASKYILMNIN